MCERVIDYDIAASRATKPQFYRAPHPGRLTPYDYQQAAVEYALGRDHALLGDAPGLGKTAESLLLGNAIDADRTLVICPASLRLNWEREIWAWSTIGNVGTYPILKAKDGVSDKAHYVITSYAMLNNKAILEAIMALRWDHLILDEAHALKDPRGNRRTKAVCGWMNEGSYVPGLRDVAGRITMASGTILPNAPIECYNTIRLLDHSAINFASLDSFRKTYYEMGEGFVRGPHEVELEDGSTITRTEMYWSREVRNVPCNLADLQYRLRKHIMVRRLKAQVLPQLPKRQWHPFPLEPNADIRKALKHPGWDQAQRLYDMDPEHFDAGVPIDGAISTARRELGEAKAPLVAQYIVDLLESGIEKVLVSAWHHNVLDILREKLSPYGLVYMDGSTSTVNKQAAVDQFQDNPEVRIILGQQMPMGEGWTLTAAQDAVLAEFDWVPGRNDQVLEWLERIGQEGSYVTGHLPIVPGTLDERMLSRAIEKDKSIYAALDKLS